MEVKESQKEEGEKEAVGVFTLTAPTMGGYYPHFTEEETKAPKGWVTCLRPHGTYQSGLKFR